MTYVREPIPHSHPCGICTRLGACSCDYPAVSTDFVCDSCHYDQARAEDADLRLHLELTTQDVDVLQTAILTLWMDQTHRTLADRVRAIIFRAVPS
jgi:hypothetical protein